jgi:hypothetical protein
MRFSILSGHNKAVAEPVIDSLLPVDLPILSGDNISRIALEMSFQKDVRRTTSIPMSVQGIWTVGTDDYSPWERLSGAIAKREIWTDQ